MASHSRKLFQARSSSSMVSKSRCCSHCEGPRPFTTCSDAMTIELQQSQIRFQKVAGINLAVTSLRSIPSLGHSRSFEGSEKREKKPQFREFIENYSNIFNRSADDERNITASRILCRGNRCNLGGTIGSLRRIFRVHRMFKKLVSQESVSYCNSQMGAMLIRVTGRWLHMSCISTVYRSTRKCPLPDTYGREIS